MNLLLVTTGVAAVAIALEKQTDHFRTLHTEDGSFVEATGGSAEMVLKSRESALKKHECLGI